jgi:RNA polymerase sigma factor (sigma-70 family)
MTVSYDMHNGRSAFYDRFFQENYPALKRWALQITSNDRELAEDLLHDVYLRVSQRTDQHDSIDSVNAYLYTAIRNGFISHLRRRTRMGWFQLSAAEDDFGKKPTMIVDPRLALKVQEELRAICNYACERKSSSISASILILRFIHGYYSAEVARVINRSRNAVEARLLKARREVSQHLLGAHERDAASPNHSRSLSRQVVRAADLLDELRQVVFSAADGRCMTDEKLKRAYRPSSGGLDRSELSHLVSCPECLDHVNRLLRMPLLGERHPLDSIGSQTVIETLERNRSLAAGAGI